MKKALEESWKKDEDHLIVSEVITAMGRDLHSKLTDLAWRSHAAGNSGGFDAYMAGASLVLSCTIQSGSELHS